MSKKIKFDYNGNTYNLTYTRRTIEKMEDEGFDITAAQTKPMSTLPKLFKGAFYANHPNIEDNVIDEIYGLMKDKQGLIQVLAGMYNDTLKTLLDEPTDEKNILWTTSV